MYPMVVVAWLLAGSFEVKASNWWWPGWWGGDGFGRWTYQPTWQTVYTGYWNSPYANPYWSGNGWAWALNGYGQYMTPYVNRYNMGWTPGALNWFYGFADRYTYLVLNPVWTPRNIYCGSYYWDPPNNTARVIDFATSADEVTGAITALPVGTFAQVQLGPHEYTVSVGDLPLQSGTFSTPTVIAGDNGVSLKSYLQGTLGMSDIDYAAFLASPMGADLSSLGSGEIAVCCTDLIVIPEPGALSFLFLGAIALGMRRRFAR